MPRHTVQQLLQNNLPLNLPNAYSRQVLLKLTHCRTAAMGYHQLKCDKSDCNHIHYRYHSCRNRHCPACNWQKQQQWMEARLSELLPVKYYHVVFTLPEELNPIVMGNRTALFKLLFDTAAHCLLSLCADPKWMGATPSITAVLHTWGQQLWFHPHVHCIVSGGGADSKNNWLPPKKKSHQGYLLPYDVMEPFFKKCFLRRLKHLVKTQKVKLPPSTDFKQLLDVLYQKKWVLYAKTPFGGVSQAVEYLARYAYKAALSNHRILQLDDSKVTISYKDYHDGHKIKTMQLTHQEFIRRFEQHILPRGFVKMRHYGILGNSRRRKRINQILQKMNLPPHPPRVHIPWQLRLLEKYGVDASVCPKCQQGHLIPVAHVFPPPRASPLPDAWSQKPAL